MPGVTDALGARLVERAGFSAAYATGAGIANAHFGLADIGLVSLGELAGQASRVIDATGLPVIVDADTGFGSAGVRMYRQRIRREKPAASDEEVEARVQAWLRGPSDEAGDRLRLPARR